MILAFAKTFIKFFWIRRNRVLGSRSTLLSVWSGSPFTNSISKKLCALWYSCECPALRYYRSVDKINIADQFLQSSCLYICRYTVVWSMHPSNFPSVACASWNFKTIQCNCRLVCSVSLVEILVVHIFDLCGCKIFSVRIR